ncbi:WXG100 family type VII secretion target [Kitasatospora sp. McL0602]|uniref:WXG100 family type VII secretion target n=1 Tax=Kitasatospora sp. McL0602 TaxID=3439530 RepID=UPI003F8A85A1
MSQQGSHLSQLAQWSGNQCANTDGFDGLLLLPLKAIAPSVAHFFADKINQCQRGMVLVNEKIQRTSADYTQVDQQHAVDLISIYPAGSLPLPDISSIPGGSAVGNFTDEPVELKEPTSAEDDTTKAIKHALWATSGKGEIKAAEKMFKFCTGQSLIGLMFDPLIGEFGRLRYLSDAYEELGDGIYTVAGTLRKGSWKLGSEWQGQTAQAFDEYLFRWSMGLGGVGDAAKSAAKIYKDAYTAITVLVAAALREIDKLIREEIEQLAKQAAEMLAGDAAIEAVGLGPEDPLADVGAGIYTAYKMYKIYKIVQKIVNGIATIVKIYEEIQKAVDGIHKGIQAIMDAINSPMPTLGSLVNDVEQRGFEFEKSGGWSSTMGAARIGMIPAA